jgi:hypothetical protein
MDFVKDRSPGQEERPRRWLGQYRVDLVTGFKYADFALCIGMDISQTMIQRLGLP